MDKLIEMTMDGRLSLIWAFLACCAIVVVWEMVSLVRGRTRRVSGSQRPRKY